MVCGGAGDATTELLPAASSRAPLIFFIFSPNLKQISNLCRLQTFFQN